MTRDDTRCPRFAPGLSLGRVQAPTLTEISGLVVSKKNSDVLWVHNDSGNAAELIALNTKGRTVAQFALPSAENVDWEDMAQGPGPSPHESYLFIGDIGGNRTPRHRIVLYRVVEPDLGAVQRSIWHEALAATPLTLEYPGAEFHDAEAIFFDPRSAGDLYVVTKDRHGASRVYRARGPLRDGPPTTLEFVLPLQFPHTGERGSDQVTAAATSPSGAWIALKTYARAYLWSRAQGASVEAVLSSNPCTLPLAKDESQGETFAFTPDDSGYFTVSEGASQSLHFFARRAAGR